MSPRDVYDNEMDGPHDFDDRSTEALLGGAGRDVDSALADVVGDMRVAYTSQMPAVGAELAALIGTRTPAVSPLARRFEQMRSSIIAKVAAATAVVAAATGGLAVAGALPAPVQDAVSHIGVGKAAHDADESSVFDADETTTTTVEPTTTTVPDGTTPTSVEHPDNHGAEVSAVAHEHDGDGCEHGHAVAAVASRGKSNGQPCHTTTTTIGDGTTPPTVDDHHGRGHEDGDDENVGQGTRGQSGNHGGGHDATPPTTTPGNDDDASDHHNDDEHRRDDHAGDNHGNDAGHSADD